MTALFTAEEKLQSCASILTKCPAKWEGHDDFLHAADQFTKGLKLLRSRHAVLLNSLGSRDESHTPSSAEITALDSGKGVVQDMINSVKINRILKKARSSTSQLTTESDSGSNAADLDESHHTMASQLTTGETDIHLDRYGSA